MEDEGKTNTFQRRDFFLKYLLRITAPPNANSPHKRVLHNVWTDLHKQTMVLNVLTIEVLHHFKQDISVFVCRVVVTLQHHNRQVMI